MKLRYLQNYFCAIITFCLFSFCGSSGASAQIVNTICGNGSASYSGDGGSALSGTLNLPVTVATDVAGNLYIADNSNYVIRKITLATGIITTICGTGSAGFGGDGGPATAAQINFASGVYVDGSGNVYISDRYNERVRMINTSGVINTIAGTGTGSFSGDGGPATAATLYEPGRVYVDGSGNIYISDRSNYRIRIINPSGTINTLLGNGSASFGGDGGAATAAQINIPYGMVVDASGNFYLADLYNYRVRIVNSSGIVNTVAGTGSSSFSGDGGAASSAGIAGPEGLVYDAAGNMYIGCFSDNRIRIINTSGVINTFAGTGSTGFSGDGGPATAATFNLPGGLAFHRNAIFVADQYNNRIRRIGLTNSAASFDSGATSMITVCENSTSNSVSAQLAVLDSDEFQPETWSVYTGPSHGSLSGFPDTWLSNGGIVQPQGVTYTPTSGYTGTDAFQVIVFDGIVYDTIQVNVTVTPAPNAGTITGSSTVCAGTTITLADASPGGTWSSSNAAQATISSTGIVTGLVVSSPTITYTVTNGCGTAYTTYGITVLPQPVAGTISGLTAVCVGQTITLSGTGTGGSWSATNGNASVSTGGVVTGNSGGLDTIRYSVTNSCGTAVASYPVTVNALPSAITGATPLCAGGNTVILTDVTTGGVWSSSNTGFATVSTTGTVTSVGAGTVNISYTNPTTNCAVAVAIVVNPLPAVIGGPTNICLGSSIALTETTGGGNWTSSNSGIASVNTTGGVYGGTIGSATISYTLSSTGCFVTQPVTVTAVPPAITGSAFICVGVSTVMSNSSAGGTWSTSNAGIASIDGSGNATGVAAGSATITYTNGGCYSTLAVAVGSSPGPITGPIAVCVGSAVTVSNASTGGSWSSSNTGLATIDGGGSVTGVSPGTATISYSLGSGCTSTASMTVNPVPVAITGTTTVCAGGATVSLSDATGGGSWSTSSAAIASVNAASGIVTGVGAGSATISYTRLGCYNTTTVTVNPQAPSIITPMGDTMLCPGGFVILTGPTFSTYTYQWYNGASPISGETSSIYTAFGAGNYRLQITNSYGCISSSSPMAVTMNPVTAVATATGATTVCGGSSAGLSATTGAGLSYQWATGGGGIAGATNPTYGATATGNYYVVVTNAAGCSAASSPVYITVLPAPATAVTVYGATSFCSGDSVSIATAAGSGLTYQWQVGGVNIAGATGNTYTATTTGNYQVVVTNSYPCSAASAIVAVNAFALPSANITVAGSPTFCGGSSVSLSTVAGAGNTYQWIFNGSPISGATNVNYTASSGGNYAVKVVAPTGCTKTTTPPQALTEMATPYLVPLSSVTHCWGGTTLLEAHTSTTIGIAYQWQYNGTDIAGATNNTYGAGPTGNYSCVISLAAGGCSSGSPWIAVTEVALPNPMVTYDGTYLKTDTGFLTYQWSRNSVVITGANTNSYLPTSTGYYSVEVANSGGCRSISPVYPLTVLHHGGTGVTVINKDDIKIFPNPAQNIINIVANAPLRAVMTTVDGRKVIDEKDAQTIDISMLADGIYMLMLYDADGIMVKAEKVTKE